ncbi:hypothetical protein DV515_00015442 [Chloebia gouldiae]|uniref:Uncharacterized protein n=1 Tax=Chloebia gouldiae TaxID=44316 RepID=A0A3L8RVE4_CHLGU|nr:hypothetical protein DV515_00015442 [Chloebia gouldiae]
MSSAQGAPYLGLTLLVWGTERSTSTPRLMELLHEQDLTCTNSPPSASRPCPPSSAAPGVFSWPSFWRTLLGEEETESPPAPGATCDCWDGV